MAIVAKCTFFLRYQQAGVSFNIYSKPDNLEAMLQPTGAAKNSKIDRFWLTFLPMLGSGITGPYVRISNEAVRNDSLFFDKQYLTISTNDIPQNGINVVQVKVIDSDEPDFCNTSALVSLAASSTQKGRLFMRFIPDNIVDYPVGLNPTIEWDKQFKKWVALLVADQWCIRCLADDVTQPPKPIQKVFRTASGENLSVTTYENHGYNVKDVVRISKVSGSAGTNGIFTVDTVTNATTFTLRNTTGTTINVGTGGFARKRVFEYPTITNAGYRRVTGRKAGRPFGSPVGRRKRTSV
jgi:hypothetical protein